MQIKWARINVKCATTMPPDFESNDMCFGDKYLVGIRHFRIIFKPAANRHNVSNIDT